MTRLQDFVQDFINQEGIGRNELARRMHVANSTISKLMSSQNKPTLYVLNALSHATGAELAKLNELASDQPVDIDLEAMEALYSRLGDSNREKVDFLLHQSEDVLSPVLDKAIAELLLKQQRKHKR